MKYAEATLGSGDLRAAVRLPDGEDLNEWIAVNVVDFFNQINMLYGTIMDVCTSDSCKIMSAGPKCVLVARRWTPLLTRPLHPTRRYEYMWSNDDGKKPVALTAPQYIEHLMTWVQAQLDDEALFPTKVGVPFPKTFLSVCARCSASARACVCVKDANMGVRMNRSPRPS
jgi:MOB kinase activator 1